jgi:hypothetical protein
MSQEIAMNVEAVRELRKIGSYDKGTYSLPHELVEDPSFNTRQKREILAEWASDACAIESFPTLRLLPGTTFPVTLSSILDALASLDSEGRTRIDGEKYASEKAGAKRRRSRAPYRTGREWRKDAAGYRHAAN